MPTNAIRKSLDFLGEAWATFFFVGRLPKAPGTAGSLAALPFAWFVWTLDAPLAWAVVATTFLLGVAGAHVVHKRTGVSDHQSIVIDEVVGILITTSVAAQNWQQYFLAFALFRFFDIVKPWPVCWFDRNWHSALGTMIDDAVAALMATALLFCILRYAPEAFVSLL